MAYEKETRFVFNERFAKFFVMDEKEKAKIIIKTLNKNHSIALLEKMNFPFIKKGDN